VTAFEVSGGREPVVRSVSSPPPQADTSLMQTPSDRRLADAELDTDLAA